VFTVHVAHWFQGAPVDLWLNTPA
jgi:hypothetical protein